MMLGSSGIVRANGAAAAASWTAIPGSIQNLSFPTTATWSSVAVNSAATDTVIVFATINFNNINSVTINGDAMTEAVDDTDSGDNTCAIFYKVGAYTTPDIVITASGGIQAIGMSAGKWSGASAVPANPVSLALGFRSDPHATSAITIPSGGIGLAIAAVKDSTPPTTSSGTIAGDYASDSSGTDLLKYLVGYQTASGSWTPSFEGDGFGGYAVCAITLGP
jgi:hypothetical protein